MLCKECYPSSIYIWALCSHGSESYIRVLDYTWNLKCLFYPCILQWWLDPRFWGFWLHSDIQTPQISINYHGLCKSCSPTKAPWVCRIICGNKWKTGQTLLLALGNYLTSNALLGRGNDRICKDQGQNTQLKKCGQSCGLSQCATKQWRRTRLKPP